MARVNQEDIYQESDPRYDDMLRQSVMEQLDPNGQSGAAQQPPAPPAPTAPAFSGGGGPPLPNDPYYAQYQQEHGLTGGAAPVGPQLNYDNSAYQPPPPAPAPQPAPNTQPSPSPPVSPAPAPSAPATPGTIPNVQVPTGMSQMPPEIANLLQQLQSGLSNLQTGTVSQASQVTPAYSELVRNAIMSAIQEGQQPVNASDPMVAPLLQALQGRSQRAKEENQGRVAEQLAAHHLLNSGAYDTSVERYNQGIDEGASNTTAQVMTQVLSDRKNRLMQAIQLGSNYLNADQARQLQAELANVNSALQQYQVKGSLGLNLLQTLLSNQFNYDALGLRAGEDAQNANSNALGF